MAIGPAPPSMAISTVGQSLCVGNDPAGTLSKVNAVTRQVEQTVSTGLTRWGSPTTRRAVMCGWRLFGNADDVQDGPVAHG